MKRLIHEIEDELDELQIAYINEDDEIEQLEIVRKFTSLLNEATDTDHVDRIAAGVNINNWGRGTVRET
jgi:hypothetical protein